MVTIMNKNAAVLERKEGLLLTLLGGLALLAIQFAQVSSSSCTYWVWEQPKMPKSLIEKD